MAMMKVRVVGVRVDQRLVSVGVTVRPWICRRRVLGTVLVSMVRVMNMRMGVFHLLVNVLVLVSLREVEPNTDDHTRRANPEERRHPFSPRNDRQRGAHERREREIRAGSSR